MPVRAHDPPGLHPEYTPHHPTHPSTSIHPTDSMARITGPAIQPTLATLLNTHALAPSMTAALPATCTVTQATQRTPSVWSIV
ncbi:hypothetical protein FRC12_000216 [Ceratobasidium sp. 428]|nr:hypothetical protein FRC12_000216 [Ceratobasidium sp. 428]